MVINQAFKFRLYPNTEQYQALIHQLGYALFEYNYFLRQRMDRCVAYMGEKKPGLKYSGT
jgi:transposase